MPVGPKEVFKCTRKDSAVVWKIVDYIDRSLRDRMYWDGESPVKVSFLLSGIPFPKLAIRAEVQGLFTEGEDHWSSVGFLMGSLFGWTVILKP